MLAALTADPRNTVYIISGRARAELADWFGSVVSRTKGWVVCSSRDSALPAASVVFVC